MGFIWVVKSYTKHVFRSNSGWLLLKVILFLLWLLLMLLVILLLELVFLNEPQFKAAIIQMETHSLQLLILNYLRKINGSNQTQLQMLFCLSRSWKSFYYLSNHSEDGPKVVMCVSPCETNYSYFLSITPFERLFSVNSRR